VIAGAGDSVLATVSTRRGPSALCYNPENNKVYCSGSGINVIDGGGDTLIATVPVGGGDLCYNHTDNKVYCTSGDNVNVIDGATDQIIATLRVGVTARALCYNPQDNRVYCANYSSGDVAVIDGATDQVIATADVGVSPRAICYSPQNNKVYCANYWGADVTVIDCANNQAIATIVVGARPLAICPNPVQNRAYVVSWESSTISVLCDSMLGAEESFGPRAAVLKPAPTIVRDVLFLPGLGTRSELPERNSVMSRAALLDISGRKVVDLHPGANDVRALAPGVYFVRDEGQGTRDAGRTQKVVITK
jgi:YVTN family beta-propeller protein